MKSTELKGILDEIMEKEELGIKALADRAGVDRGNLGAILNGTTEKPVRSDLIRKLRKSFGKYFPTVAANPTETIKSDKGKGASGGNKDLSIMIESHASIARAMEKAQENFAKCQAERDDLRAMLKANLTPVEQANQDFSMNNSLVYWIAKLGTALGEFQSVEDGRTKIGNTTLDTLGLNEGADSGSGLGKQRKPNRRS
jgi:hypothetical protein